eukprot:530512-Amphidinium_carterae.1
MSASVMRSVVAAQKWPESAQIEIGAQRNTRFVESYTHSPNLFSNSWKSVRLKSLSAHQNSYAFDKRIAPKRPSQNQLTIELFSAQFPMCVNTGCGGGSSAA